MALKGDWFVVKAWLRRASTGKFHKKAEEQLQVLEKDLQNTVVGHIERQDLSWPALKPSTVKKKGSRTIYIDSGQYKRNIKTEIKRKRFSTKITVGPSQVKAHKGLTFQTLASYLEYGTSKQLARPLWRPSFNELKRKKKYRQILRLIDFNF